MKPASLHNFLTIRHQHTSTNDVSKKDIAGQNFAVTAHHPCLWASCCWFLISLHAPWSPDHLCVQRQPKRLPELMTKTLALTYRALLRNSIFNVSSSCENNDKKVSAKRKTIKCPCHNNKPAGLCVPLLTNNK
jgi:hypothetical protein